jgi:hypothetical protein
MKSDAECAACLGLEVTSEPAGLDAAPLDARGCPILPDARVYVPARPGIAGVAEVPAFSGFVISANSSEVHIQEIGTFHWRTVRPADVRVKKGTTKAATDHRTAAAALKGTTRTKRGLKQIAVEAQTPASKSKSKPKVKIGAKK